MNNKILIIGPNHPRKCGIATHVNQEYLNFVNQGNFVKILSSKDCNSHFKENTKGFFNPLKILKYYKDFDTIYLHFSPEQYFYTYYNPLRLFNLLPLLSFYIIFKKCENLIFVVHELPLNKYFFQKLFIHKYIWQRVTKILFFTYNEKINFQNKFQILFKENQYLIENVNKNFIKYCKLNQDDAMIKLNLPKNKKILLAIGFINFSKGFDRIVSIFNSKKFQNSILYIVGEARCTNNFEKNYFESLKLLCHDNVNIILINEFLTDEKFDIWTIASDFLVFPYRANSNSGVLGRAKLYCKNVIVSDIGGLCNQIEKTDILFKNDNELENILKNIDKQIIMR